MNYYPKVSVIIPCKNDGLFINETILSIREQTYKNIEIIIVDDGSDDPSTKLALKSLETSCKIIYQPISRGPSAARNCGIRESVGTYILPLDSDDLIGPTYIEKAVNILNNNPNVGIVYCEAEFFDKRSGKWALPEFSLKTMALDNCIFVSALFRKEDWLAVGGYDEHLIHGNEDYDFWLSILEKNRDVHRIDETLFFYRIKSHSRSSKFAGSSIDVITDTYYRIYQNHPNFFHNNMREIIRQRIVLAKAASRYWRIEQIANKLKVRAIARYFFIKINRLTGSNP